MLRSIVGIITLLLRLSLALTWAVLSIMAALLVRPLQRLASDVGTHSEERHAHPKTEPRERRSTQVVSTRGPSEPRPPSRLWLP
jgi:hypothetical protein